MGPRGCASKRRAGIAASTCLLLSAVSAPAAARGQGDPPRDPRELSAWLKEDPAADRLWAVLKATAGDSTVPASVREVLVRHLMETVPPHELETHLFSTPARIPTTLALLREALASRVEGIEPLESYIAEVSRERGLRLSRRGPPFDESTCQALLTLMFVDPQRFVTDPAFRERVLSILPRAFDPKGSAELRDLLLWSLNQVPGIEFEESERIETAWGAAPRTSLIRERSFVTGELEIADDSTGTIEASFFSFPSRFLDPAPVLELLRGLRAIAPERTLVALVDLPLREALAADARALRVDMIETHGRRYTPWIRDPLTLARNREGAVAVLLRPPFERQRVGDELMGLEWIQGLPERLDRLWGHPQWAATPVFFHNGHILVTRETVWVSLHSLEYAILALLDLPGVPVEELSTPSGWAAYVQAAERAAVDLGRIYQRKVRFVHPLPKDLSPGELVSLTRDLTGGAGYDLDSLLTIVESADGGLAALVADVERGRKLIEEASVAELERFRDRYRLAPEVEPLRERLRAAQETPRSRGLDDFLERVATTLTSDGMKVQRLPILEVPAELLSEPVGLEPPPFLITWNNVVLERRGEERRAEGFASHLASGDAIASRVFANAGYTLQLLPPLVRSVTRGGGYRCASQHLRAGERPPAR